MSDLVHSLDDPFWGKNSANDIANCKTEDPSDNNEEHIESTYFLRRNIEKSFPIMLMETMPRKISTARDSDATDVAALRIAAVSAVDLIMGFTSSEMTRMSRQIKSAVMNNTRVESTDMPTRTMIAISRTSPSDMVPNLAVLASVGGIKCVLAVPDTDVATLVLLHEGPPGPS